MRLVVDVNVVISSLMKDGISFKVFSLNSILQKFELVAPDFFMSEISRHKEELLLSDHLKDVPYVALALKFNCPIFSGDKILKNLSPVKVCSPRELFDLLTAA
jgi:predicted nucleic acid-binding protein